MQRVFNSVNIRHSNESCLSPSGHRNGRFYTRRRIIRLDELGQTFVVRLVMPVKYKDGHETHYPSRPTIFRCASSSRRTMSLVPVFILETDNQRNNKCLPKFIQEDNVSSSIKQANEYQTILLAAWESNLFLCFVDDLLSCLS